MATARVVLTRRLGNVKSGTDAGRELPRQGVDSWSSRALPEDVGRTSYGVGCRHETAIATDRSTVLDTSLTVFPSTRKRRAAVLTWLTFDDSL